MLHEAARAKVNLFLRVVGRRADGYHLLDSLAVFPGAADLLSAEPSDALTLAVSGPFGASLAGEADNLVLRAARALAAAAGVQKGAAIRLEKRLPVASGIGGGSADAAATLRLLGAAWGVALPGTALQAIAATLGADVPVCLVQQPARMSGIGDQLGPAPRLPECGIVLVNPGVAVATPAVFRARMGGFSAPAGLPAAWCGVAELAAWLRGVGNDLEAPAIGLCPPIADVLGWLAAQDGCLLSRMSGSGATCFGLFTTAGRARAVAAGVPGVWWGWGGAMLDS